MLNEKDKTMVAADQQLKENTEAFLGKKIVKAKVGVVNTLWFDNSKDAETVNNSLAKRFKTHFEEEYIREPLTKSMTREERRNRKRIKTGLYVVLYS